ncbi:type I secretion system permease/ATPase [Roseibacterium sp. SDUM158017]|uniref:type I secretion system permease/ATPase n=1 Tax=Roseicyclus salinarum TaxID=3036773 RepID=UPI002414D8DF|nr:type I secretion system permease/ATPase [Roseibacterium sp. SDUM158017]MDG4649277.1 type I secretion system permease/ATPase [Roseibacterium sp. SDUM158017]
MKRRNAWSGLRTRSGGLVLATFVFSIFTNLLMLTGPLFMLQIYDRVLASRSEETLVALFGLVSVLYFFYWLIEHARGRVMSRVGARLQDGLNARTFRAVVDRSARRQPGPAGSLQDIEAVRTLFSSPVILALFDIPWTPVFLTAIFIFHPMLGWLAVAGGGVLVCTAILNQLLTYRKTASAGERSKRASRFALQVELSGEYVVAQGMRGAMTERWGRMQDEAMDHAMRANDRTGSATAFTRAFRLFLQSAMLALGAWLVLRGEMTAGAMIAASILLGRALAPVEIGVSQWAVVQSAQVSWKALKTLLGQEGVRDPQTVLPAPRAHLDLRSVTLVPKHGERPVLSQVSLEVRPGKALGIIGRSGSGKTTLARIVTGVVPPSAGEVRLAGATPDQYASDRLGGYIGYLPQDVQFFDGTVAENIARMASDPDDAKVVEAAKKARVHDIILSLPEGYDTQVNGSAVSLSGGQKQRLALARALYGDPVLLVLDEPNSALDAEGSEALNAAVTAMKKGGGAVLIMTHRPTAISTCDDLLVLEGGKAAAYGDRDQVIRNLMKNAGDVQRVVAGGRP